MAEFENLFWNSEKNKSATLADSLFPPSPMPADTQVNESMRADIDEIIGNTETEITSQNPAEKEIDLQERCSNENMQAKIIENRTSSSWDNLHA